MLNASSGVAQQYKNAFFYYIINAEFSSAAQAQWKKTNLYITLLNIYSFYKYKYSNIYHKNRKRGLDETNHN